MEYVYPPAKAIDYRKTFKWKALVNPEEISALLEGETKIAFDTETTGLDPKTSKIAGYSFSLDGVTGYYVPIMHKHDTNAPREALDIIVEFIKTCPAVLMYNKKFDLNMLEIAEGYSLGNCFNVHEVMALTWLRDCDVKFPSLKWASEFYLGIRQPKFDDVMGETSTFDFALVDEITEYAALDAICTYRLASYMIEKMPKVKGIYKIDNLSVEAVRNMENVPIPVDYEWLKKEAAVSTELIISLKKEIMDMVGYEFNPDSNVQKAEALLSMGVQLTSKTEKGNWKVAIDQLKELDDPLAAKLVDYSKEIKYHNSYVSKLQKEYETKQGEIRFNYHPFRVPTGRMASGADKKNAYYAHLNIQSVPKSSQIDVAVIKSKDSPTGFKVVDLDIAEKSGVEHYVTESGAKFHGIREAFIPEDDESVFVSIDYKTEELRIAANLSGEPIWLDAFKNGRDLHMETAKAVFGQDADKNDRKKAKIINFAALYGATEYTLHKKMGVSISEAKLYLDKYWDALKHLSRWKQYVTRKAVREDVFTWFGRPRRMSRYFNDKAERSYRAYGYRTSVNTIVQGTAGDIIRIALGKMHLWREKNPELAKNFRPLTQVHDEINFTVRKDWIHQFMNVVPELMTMRFKEWEVPIEVDVSIGDNWGRVVSYSYENGVFKPEGNYVDGNG